MMYEISVNEPNRKKLSKIPIHLFVFAPSR